MSPPARRLIKAHPRSRGENGRESNPALHSPGSSPLTRGKRRPDRILGYVAGLIPAHAGKTLVSGDLHELTGAHPRSRGENRSCDEVGATRTGSSPLTRGKRQGRPSFLPKEGLIPAHAGKTRRPDPRMGRAEAHPRSRGENMTQAPKSWPEEGSSPLTRGKLPVLGRELARAGLIPAHAGKTFTAVSRTQRSRAHPRSRGENLLLVGVVHWFTGSSPLTRGKRWRASPAGRSTGLIPAHAGKTSAPPSAPTGIAAHPRSRGENVTTAMRRCQSTGPSPLTRGKPRRCAPGRTHTGLIPAHAGKTKPTIAHIITNAAHPRSRGENRVLKPGGYLLAGSSPLTRGKHPHPGPRAHAWGLIPAHAGKTGQKTLALLRIRAHPRSRGENVE